MRVLLRPSTRAYRGLLAFAFGSPWLAAFGKPTSQALVAQETLDLYKWWKYQRPNRPDPYEVSGWNKCCNKNFKSSDNHSKKTLDACLKIEKEQGDEDTKMLIRLIKIRQNLWT